MNNAPKISIIVPIYNVEKYLRQCIDSIVNQTLKEIEIILVNDGSKDGSLAIMQEYAQQDSRIIIIDKPNSGYGHTMNTGLESATGTYIGIVESDDWVELNMFETLYALAEENDAEVVKSDFYYYWFHPEKNVKANVLPQQDLNQIINPSIQSGIFWTMPCIWSAIYKKSFINEHHIRFLETPGASYQDTAFNFKVWALAQRVFLTETAFLHYRQDNENSSVNSPHKVFCVCDEWHEIEGFISKNNFNTDLAKLAQRLKYATYIWNFERLAYPLNYQFLKRMVTEFKIAQQEHLIDRELFTGKEYRHLTRMIKSPFYFFIGYSVKSLRKRTNHAR